MDFFSRCRMCLQCLPFTSSDSPPPPPHKAAHAAATEASKDGDKTSSSDALPLSEHATELDPSHMGKLSGSLTKSSCFSQDGENQGGSASVAKPEENEYHAGNANNHHLGHGYALHHIHDTHDYPPHSSLEGSQSVPAEMHDIHSGNAGGVSGTELSVPSQSEPIIEAFEDDEIYHGPHRVRRRDQLKHQLKDLRNQIRQGGRHLKEEGSKHLRGIMSNVNTQGQQLAGAGSFFTSPRGNDS